MPELPEVETIKSQLQTILPFRIDEIAFSAKTNRLIKTRDFNLKNFTIAKISRYGKWLVLALLPEGYLLSHLGMSGSWQISSMPLKNKHGHIEFIDQSQNKVLTYVDPRRFGHFYILNKENFFKKMSNVPPDISDPDFDENKIAENFFKFPNKILKPFLLDQHAFPGIGNYMASEICARAKVLPNRLTGSLTQDEIMRIKESIDVVIAGALKTKGTAFSGGYRDAYGDASKKLDHLVVFYQKICQQCLKYSVVKTNLGGRGTYHCPICQS